MDMARAEKLAARINEELGMEDSRFGPYSMGRKTYTLQLAGIPNSDFMIERDDASKIELAKAMAIGQGLLLKPSGSS
jgi:hypothetical protein